MRTSRLLATIVVLALLSGAARAAEAQQPPPPPPVTAGLPVTPAASDSARNANVDTLRSAFGFDASLVRPGSWLYTTTLRSDTTVRLLGEVEVRVAESTYAGMPSWLLTEVGLRSGAVVADSLWVTRADLRPQHWSATLGVARLSAEFARDTVYSAIMEPIGRRSLVAHGAPKLLVSEAMSDVVLSMMPLDSTFTDSVAILAIDLGATASPPARIFVEGQESVVVPAGTFDAWIVSLESERGSARIWVSRENPRMILKSEQTLPALGGAVLRRELLRGN